MIDGVLPYFTSVYIHNDFPLMTVTCHSSTYKDRVVARNEVSWKSLEFHLLYHEGTVNFDILQTLYTIENSFVIN